ncbi:MAG TPA: uracil-DNA glycosylase [Pirellulales bacterium]|jgi:DNA polymerase
MGDRVKDSRSKAARVVGQRLESLQRAGVSHLKKAKRAKGAAAADLGKEEVAAAGQVAASNVALPPHPSPLPGGDGARAKPIAAKSPFDSSGKQAPLSPEQRIEALAIVQREVAACTRCKVLADTRTQTVFGVGSPTARICLFGEAPGADEDRQGIPFVGRAGQLLTKMIQACTLSRDDVYILNVLKCRPPENRNPLPEEAANCREYFERQLEIIRPEIICCLGAVAAKTLLNTETSIGKLRGKFHQWRGTDVICTYHPAYLLRNPAAKPDAWEDLKMMMRKLGVDL